MKNERDVQLSEIKIFDKDIFRLLKQFKILSIELYWISVAEDLTKFN